MQTKMQETEQIAQILDGDERAYGQLIDCYKEGLYRHCYRIVRDEETAKDITQEAFIDAYVHLEEYNPAYRFSTWLYKLATNRALMLLRKQRDLPLDEQELATIQSELATPDTEYERAEVRSAVAALHSPYREIVAEHYWDGLSYIEIADRHHTTTGTIKGWMARAKRQLKELLS